MNAKVRVKGMAIYLLAEYRISAAYLSPPNKQSKSTTIAYERSV